MEPQHKAQTLETHPLHFITMDRERVQFVMVCIYLYLLLRTGYPSLSLQWIDLIGYLSDQPIVLLSSSLSKLDRITFFLLFILGLSKQLIIITKKQQTINLIQSNYRKPNLLRVRESNGSSYILLCRLDIHLYDPSPSSRSRSHLLLLRWIELQQ